MPMISIDGKNVDLSDEVAALISPIIAKRDADAAAAAEAAAALGAARAEAAAAAAAAAETKRKKDQDELIKNGESKKALELAEERTHRVAGKYARDAAMALLRPMLRQDLSPVELEDIAAAVAGNVEFDLASETLRAKGGGDAKAALEKWAADRPTIRGAKPASGSGGGAGPAPDPQTRRSTMTDDQRLAAIVALGRERYLALPY